MNLADVAETAVIGALMVAGIEPVTRSSLAVAAAIGKARAAKAAANAAPAPAPPTSPAGAADERPAPAVIIRPEANGHQAAAQQRDPVTGQMLRADGSNRALDTLKAMVASGVRLS